MAASGPPLLSECTNEQVNLIREKIWKSRMDKKFFATRSLREILTLDEIRKILKHHSGSPGCLQCNYHLEKSPELSPGPNDAERIHKTDSSLNLFACLVHLGFPLLIECFLCEYEGKVPYPRFLSENDLTERFFIKLPTGRRLDKLVEEFEEDKWGFSVPVFDTGSFVKYPDRVIMPYLTDEKVAEGGFGKVYKVEIQDGYCSPNFQQSTGSLQHMSSPSRSITLARKEYSKDQAVIAFLKERTNLLLIDQLKHPHLIHIHKTYQLGNRFNILFPFAKSNLQDYLRKGNAPRDRQLSKNPMWLQLLGITEALSKLINFEGPSNDPSRGNKRLLIYHLDLKPQNVLVFANRVPGRPAQDILQISDFGQSSFENASPGNSAATTRFTNTRGVSLGTEDYAPPEYNGIGANSAYDVWSLGIILLEILAYAIRGADGLSNPRTGLDVVRHTAGPYFQDSRFYIGHNETATLKPAISTWLDELMNYDDIQDVEREQFVKPLVNLSRKMLEPDYTKRKSIDGVVSQMREIFKQGISENSDETAMSLKRNDEEILVDFRAVRIFPQGLKYHSEQKSLFILENANQTLHIYAGDIIRDAYLQRQEISVIPSFQYSNLDSDNAKHFAFAFEPVKQALRNVLSEKVIVVENESHARALQAALINHEVSRRYKVTSLELKVHIPLDQRAKASLSRLVAKRSMFSARPAQPEPSNDADGNIVPLWIELWIEKGVFKSEPEILEPIPPGQKLKPRRQNRQAAPEEAVPLGRAVVYCKDRILLVPFSKEGIIRKREDNDSSFEIHFLPMDIKQLNIFNASNLQLKTGSENVAIPMCPDLLRKLEKDNRIMCESLSVRFSQHQDAQKFYWLFRRQKSRWQSLVNDEQTKIASMVTP